MDIYDDDWIESDAVSTGEVPVGRARLLYALMEASAGGSGEVVVSEGDLRAKIHFHEGKVAWIASTDAPRGFVDHLVQLGMAERRALGDLVAACAREGRSFTEALVESGGLAPQEVRLALRDFLTWTLADLLTWPSPQVVFAPWPRRFEGRHLFPARDLVLGAIDRCADQLEPDEASGIRRVGSRIRSCVEG